MNNNIMETINNVYKSSPTLAEQEILKLDSLLTQVGGDAKSILLKAEERTMADFIDTCIRNGITFELRNDNSEEAPVSNDKPLAMQSPSGEDNSCEKGCTETGAPRLTRITLENWKELLSVGDRVVVMEGAVYKHDGVITELEDEEYMFEGFMELNCHWVWLDEEDKGTDGKEYYVQCSGDK